ncbi:MAG: S1 family peptidase [Prochlorotrichaceae cyanobacterium]
MLISWPGLSIVALKVMGIAALVWGGNSLTQQGADPICEFSRPIVRELSLPLHHSDWILAARLSLPPYLPQLERYPLDRSTLEAYADRLTVQVWGGEGLLGSGTLLGRSSSGVGWVLTNNHVLRWSTPPFQIHLSDRTVLEATWLPEYEFDGADLAILQVANLPVRAAVTPEIALSTASRTPQPVYAAGWTSKNYYPHWQFVPGQLIYELEKPLIGGYQLGYSSLVEKGMSGGPLLNAWGQLVGLNGMVAEPLWEMQHQYEDGNTPLPWVQALIQGNSWGIPSDRFAPVLQEVYATTTSPFTTPKTCMLGSSPEWGATHWSH